MKQFFFAAIIMVLLSAAATAQDKNISIKAGYGSQGPILALDCTLSDDFIEGSETRVYIQGGLEKKTFENENFRFRNQNYPSDTRVLFLSLGISQQFQLKHFQLAPFIGLRYAYTRFTDKALVDAIGEYNLVRSWNGYPVGPTVENGYGDAVTFEAGGHVGYKLSPSIEIFVQGAVSPLKFSTAATLFGKYWGESPYPNDYYIKYSALRAEGGLRFHF